MVSAVEHVTVHYTGRVQGVGFRYATLQVAHQFEVCGYVQNLPDGRVLLEAEGASTEVSAFLTELTSQMSAFIRKQESRSNPVTCRQFSTFEIRT